MSKVNLIFMPISVNNGMAGSKRLGNFIPFLLNKENYRIVNIILSNEYIVKSTNQYISTQQISVDNHNKFLYPFKVIILFKKLFQKNSTNIIYHYGYPNITNITYLFVARILHYKIVFDIVENDFAINKFYTFKSKIRILSSHYFIKRLKYFSDGVICISTQLQKMLVDFIGESIPILLLPITINKNLFTVPLVKSNLNEPTKIFYGGSFYDKDGLEYLLKAFDLVADQFNVQLAMTGKGNVINENKVMNWVSQLKNKDKIKVMGFLTDDEYFATLKSADIHCMTRISSEYANNGFPFKLGEMLATGKPVIVTCVGDVTKYLNNEEAVLIEPESVEAIVNAIKFLISFPDKAALIGDAGRKCAFNNFDAEIHSDRLCHFLESV